MSSCISEASLLCSGLQPLLHHTALIVCSIKGLTCTACLPQDSEGREQELTTRLAGKHTEQAELAGRVADCQAKLETKLQELRAVADAKQQVTTRPRVFTNHSRASLIRPRLPLY